MVTDSVRKTIRLKGEGKDRGKKNSTKSYKVIIYIGSPISTPKKSNHLLKLIK